MHFDPAGSEQSSTTDIREFPEGDVLARDARESDRTSDIDRGHAIAAVGNGPDADDAFHGDDVDEDDEDDDHEEPPAAVREGLPSRFRMRHTPHYVDELLGDAPLRTVREIPVSEIESPIDDLAELEELERSIRQLGVIEPLLVGRRGASYRVIAGMRRLRAAHRIGLDTVPCLVHEVDEDRLTDMRDAAARRLSVPPPPAPEPEPEVVPVATAVPQITQPTIGEAALGLEFVAALLPAMNAAGGDRLRWGVLTDLAAVELSRTKAIGAAHEILRSARPIDRASVDYQLLVSGVVAGVAAEARLRNVRLDVSMPGGQHGDAGRDIFLDGALCRDALAGLVQSLLGLAPRAGTVLGVAARITSIRPALIVECRLHESDPELGPETLSRFFDAGWREHPCGSNGGAVLAAFAHVARAHGGRVEIKAAARGCLATFVVPRIDG